MERFSLTAKEFEFVRRTAKETRTFLVKHNSRNSIVAKLDLSAMPDLIKVLSSNEANSKECARLRGSLGDEPEMWLPYFCGWEDEHDKAA